MTGQLHYCNILEKYVDAGGVLVRSVASKQQLTVTYSIEPDLEWSLKAGYWKAHRLTFIDWI
jgi:hypothetical protein